MFANPGGSVKEQTPADYGEGLSKDGFIVLTFDAYEFIPEYLDRPLLVVNGRESGSLWQSKRTYELSNGPKELWIVDGVGHFDFYNNPTCIKKSSE